MRFILTLLLLLFGTQIALSQVRLALEVSPVLINNRLEEPGGSGNFDSDGASLRLRLALMADLSITESYSFQTGIGYSPEQVGFSLRGQSSTQKYNLQYLQLPALLQLRTSELSIDTKLYFNVGMIGKILISDKTETTLPLVEGFRFYDASFHFGAGLEKKISTQSELYGGISYNRGLVNIISESSGSDLSIKNDLLRLDIGLRF